MAVVAIPRYSAQAVAGRFDIIEGRAVRYTTKGTGHDDLYQVEYATPNVHGYVWVAICPPMGFPVPIPDGLYSATYKSTYNIKDATIYTNPSQTGTEYLTDLSEQNQPTIVAQHSLVALYKGIIGITSECYDSSPEILTGGTQLVIKNNGIFEHKKQNDPIEHIVGRVEYYQPKSGLLYINVF